jgi:hypothetical protein
LPPEHLFDGSIPKQVQSTKFKVESKLAT